MLQAAVRKMGKSSPDTQHSCVPERILETLDGEYKKDRRNLKWALIVALIIHAVLFSITFPEVAARTRDLSRSRRVFVVREVRFKLPPPVPQRAPEVRKPRKKRIPIPDPTPDDPEPILIPQVDLPEVELPEIDVGTVFGIPEGPPAGGGASAAKPPLDLGGDVEPPVRIYTPQPRYSEEARQARLQGVVLLRSVIDEEGNVTRLEVLKGLPLGLTESALETVGTWKYEPATLNGEPVPVYFHLMVRFSVQ